MAVTQKIANKLNRIYHPGTNKSLLFRYHDPRILSAFLPAYNAGQAKAFFAPPKSGSPKQTMAKAWTGFPGQLLVISNAVERSDI